jgi:hypothetical protein
MCSGQTRKAFLLVIWFVMHHLLAEVAGKWLILFPFRNQSIALSWAVACAFCRVMPRPNKTTLVSCVIRRFHSHSVQWSLHGRSATSVWHWCLTLWRVPVSPSWDFNVVHTAVVSQPRPRGESRAVSDDQPVLSHYWPFPIQSMLDVKIPLYCIICWFDFRACVRACLCVCVCVPEWAINIIKISSYCSTEFLFCTFIHS